MRAYQRDIILVNYELPNNKYKPHPALVLSNDDINEYEERYIIVMLSTTPNDDDYTFLLDNEMFNFTFKPQLKRPDSKPQIRTHLVNSINESEITKRWGSMKQDVFCQVVEHIKTVVFSCE